MDTQTLEWTLGERLAKARRIRKWSQQEMALRLGIGRRSIVRYEDDQATPSHAILIAWASITDVPLEWLAGPTITGTVTDWQGNAPTLFDEDMQVSAYVHRWHPAAAA